MIEKVINGIGLAIAIVVGVGLAVAFSPLLLVVLLLRLTKKRYRVNDVSAVGFVLLATIASVFTASYVASVLINEVLVLLK